ncbi:MAG TPA: AMP-binding protein [Spirochaetota bacterium]|nr:AMP-binding protein [Spirochaetota bacterium]HPF05207.1 AMP-binding protein [Spirochaetota bacterium]HPJ41906.1 AMP-binding protein [Spirochaetota bacterium]HPR38225.1 AMP-binding protein [Spirochaetota bacterium]HRX47959.1 AMP-binding protein [Spirochaetota bacterium]
MKDYAWFKKYPDKIPHEIDPDRYSSLVDLFNQCVQRYDDLPAYENFEKVLTYRDIEKLTRDFAAFLQKRGLTKGDRIAIQLPNTLQYPVALFGALRAGLTVVNTNPLYTAREMKEKFQDSGAKAIVILANYASNLEEILSSTEIKTVIVTEIGDIIGGVKGSLINFVVKRIKKMVPPYNIPGSIKINDALKEGAKEKFTPVDLNKDDIAFLQYTGGTTGVAKGAILKHRNILANVEQISAWMIPTLVDKKEIVVTPLPLYHIFALTVNFFSFFNKGSKNILITDPRNIPAFIKEIKNSRFTAMTGVNTLFNAMLNNPDFKKINFSSAKVIIAGGMALQKAVAERWKQITGIPICEGYGLTETSPVLTANPIDGTERVGTIGVPLPSTEIMIADENGNEVPVGTTGELLAKGPQVMEGYWHKADETSLVFINDWFRTGDLGFIDDDGFVTIVDRKKDMIIVSGFNVYPNEIEQIAIMHPGVLEAGATGGKDENGNEFMKLFIVKKDPNLTKMDVIKHCRANLTNYKIPKVVEFRDVLPKTNVGKILRRELK